MDSYGPATDNAHGIAEATPPLLAVMTPIALGFALGYAPLGGYLAGATMAGALMAAPRPQNSTIRS